MSRGGFQARARRMIAELLGQNGAYNDVTTDFPFCAAIAKEQKMPFGHTCIAALFFLYFPPKR
jgi:hypothetical protein